MEIGVTDNSSFFIRPFHTNEEDKAILDKEMKWLCYLGILKEGFMSYSSAVMLISQKLTQDKRVVTDFRHLNMRIAKNNIAYPLYFGIASYLYQRMPMGLNISPMVWQSYMNAILSCSSSRKYCEAIMDDLLLFMPNKEMHFVKPVDLL